MVVRTYNEELQYIEKLNDYSWRIKKGFQVISNAVNFTFAGSDEIYDYFSTSSQI
jgi:hypothetical protein